jgi:hypothetical protein
MQNYITMFDKKTLTVNYVTININSIKMKNDF